MIREVYPGEFFLFYHLYCNNNDRKIRKTSEIFRMKAKPYFDFNEVSREGIEVSNVKLIEYT